MRRMLAAFVLTFAASFAVVGHTRQSAKGAQGDARVTSAYRVLILRKAAVEAELTDLSRKFTSRHPDVRRKRFELSAIGLEMEKLRATGKRLLPKLSDAYGNLLLRKVTLKVGLNDLLGNFSPQHPEVLKTRAELLSLDLELENILR